MLAQLAATEARANSGLPTLFLIGDSTVNNSGHGPQGWGTPSAYFFDTNRICVENHAIGGRSKSCDNSLIAKGRKLELDRQTDVLQRNIRPGHFTSLCQFDGTVHQLYVRVLHYIRLLDLLER